MAALDTSRADQDGRQGLVVLAVPEVIISRISDRFSSISPRVGPFLGEPMILGRWHSQAPTSELAGSPNPDSRLDQVPRQIGLTAWPLSVSRYCCFGIRRSHPSGNG